MDKWAGGKGGVYARYSSAMQKPKSVEDQLVLCRRRIREVAPAAEITTYADYAETATSMHDREGLQRLLRDVGGGRLDFVVAESLDRISRDLADLAGLYKRLRFHDVDLFTVEEGSVNALHVGLKGVMNEEHINSLALKTRRGMEGVVREGRAAGGLAYGYRVANRIGPNGQIVRGLRQIDVEQAEVVRRIYQWYAEGRPTRWIAGQLNAEGIPAPGDGSWRAVTINGNRKRGTGILLNELYRGRLTFGRTRNRRDPDTGRRRARPAPREEWTVTEVPELRIIDDDLWTVVQLRRKAGRDGGRGHKKVRPLTPVLHCGLCGGQMTIHDRSRYGCQTRRETGECENNRGVAADEVERVAIKQLCEIVLFGADWVNILESAGETVVAMQTEAHREIADTQQRLDNLIETIELGERGDGVRKRIAELERALATKKLRIRTLDVLPQETPPARGLWEQLQERVTILARRADSDDAEVRREAMIRIRDLIDRIEVVPGEEPRSVRITIRPNRNALIGLAIVTDFELTLGEPILRRFACTRENGDNDGG